MKIDNKIHKIIIVSINERNKIAKIKMWKKFIKNSILK